MLSVQVLLPEGQLHQQMPARCYMDGNGRMGRFLMNLMLASGGYPWTVIPVERRDEYMKALDKASAQLDIEPFAKFFGQLVKDSLKGNPEAKI